MSTEGLIKSLVDQETTTEDLAELAKNIDDHIIFDEDGVRITYGDNSIYICDRNIFFNVGDQKISLMTIIRVLSYLQESLVMPEPLKKEIWSDTDEGVVQ